MAGLRLTSIGDLKLTTLNYCGNNLGSIVTPEQGFLIEPIKTLPTKGEHDYKTCSRCQNTHNELIKILTARFNGTHTKGGKPFPLCCEGHSNLMKIKELDKALFIPIPELTANKIIYTNQHITNNHQKENYYDDITDYIEYTIQSFGQMPKGCGTPLFLDQYYFYLGYLLKQNTKISTVRKNKVLDFLEAYQTPTNKNKTTDLNILISTYEKWLKVFPFDISFFSSLKDQFQNEIPILNGKPKLNKYTGLTSAKLHTKNSLIEYLQQLTKSLLKEVNVSELRKNGLVTDYQAKQLEFSDAELKTKVDEITKLFSKGELKYVKVLKKWLSFHKKYFMEISPILRNLPVQKSVNSNIKKPETLSNLITHKNSIEIVEAIKIQYKNIKGKRLKILLQAFQDLNLLPLNGIAKKFHDCCKSEFDWNVASYNAMNGYNYNEGIDKDELDQMKNFVLEIINA